MPDKFFMRKLPKCINFHKNFLIEISHVIPNTRYILWGYGSNPSSYNVYIIVSYYIYYIYYITYYIYTKYNG